MKLTLPLMQRIKFRKKIARLLPALIIAACLIVFAQSATAQCSICTRTAQQQGKTAAEGLNGGIVYLMLIPLAVGGFIGYRWWQNEKRLIQQEKDL